MLRDKKLRCGIAIFIIGLFSFGRSLDIVGYGSKRPSSLADGCLNVFLDIGGNMGVQARRLFEPKRYRLKKRPVPPMPGFCHPMALEFSIAFPERPQDHRDVCVIGFEPNPGHHARLRELAERYTLLGFRTTYIFSAVGTRNGTSTLAVPQSNIVEGGAQLWQPSGTPAQEAVHPQPYRNHTVPVIDLAEFLVRHILERKVPLGLGAGGVQGGHVLAKVDIEGSEYDVFLRLLEKQHALRSVDKFIIEWHELRNEEDGRLRAVRRRLEKAATSCFLDDETYRLDPWPLPQRKGSNADFRTDKWSKLSVKSNGLFWRSGNWTNATWES